MWHVYWNENNLNWKRREKLKKSERKPEIISSRTHNKEIPSSSPQQQENVNRTSLRAMKGKSHSQTLSEKFPCKVLSENCIIPKLAISKTISSLLQSSLNIQENSHWFSLLLLPSFSSHEKKSVHVKGWNPSVKIIIPERPLQLKRENFLFAFLSMNQGKMQNFFSRQREVKKERRVILIFPLCAVGVWNKNL